MTSENRITLTILVTLVFGVFSSALVNGITDNNGVHWNRSFCHVELYALAVLGPCIIWLSKMTARESKEKWEWIKEKIEAFQAQGFLGDTPAQIKPDTSTVIQQQQPGALKYSSKADVQQPQPRVIEYSSEAESELLSINKNTKIKISTFMSWLKYASPSEIVMKDNIRKSHSDTATEFFVRIGTIRIKVNIDLQEGKITVKQISQKTT